MATAMTFADPRLATLDGFRVEIDEPRERADIVLDRPPLNVVSMPQREQLRMVFERLDEDGRIRVIVLRAAGEHFSSGGNIKGFMEAAPETLSKLAWNVAAPARCSHSAAFSRKVLPIAFARAPHRRAELHCVAGWMPGSR